MATPLSSAVPLQAPNCPLCGQPNQCAASAAGSFAVDCWCKRVRFPEALIAAVPAGQQRKACICRRCAEAAQGHGDEISPTAMPAPRPR